MLGDSVSGRYLKYGSHRHCDLDGLFLKVFWSCWQQISRKGHSNICQLFESFIPAFNHTGHMTTLKLTWMWHTFFARSNPVFNLRIWRRLKPEVDSRTFPVRTISVGSWSTFVSFKDLRFTGFKPFFTGYSTVFTAVSLHWLPCEPTYGKF